MCAVFFSWNLEPVEFQEFVTTCKCGAITCYL
jgi:hypothetical protein